MSTRWKRVALAAGVMAFVWLMGITLSLAAAQGQTVTARKQLMAEDVFKNIQVLRGVPVDDFMSTMGFMAAALGFDCDSCHEAAGTENVKWEADYPKKVMARRMVTMVQTINKQNFGGRQVVTCYTCHRGRDYPLVTPRLDLWYGESPLELDDILVSVRGGPTPDQVIDRYLEAVGGVQRLATVTSFVAKGKALGFGGFGGSGVFELSAQAPDKRATRIRFPEEPGREDSIRAYDGRVGWLTNPLAIITKYELTGGEHHGARLDALLSFPTQIRQALNNMRLGPPMTIDDQPVQTLQGNGPGNILVTMYFARDSGLLVRLIRYSPSPIGRLPTQIDYSDYRDVDGIKMPFRYIFSWLDGRDTFEIDDVQVNVAIDPAKFGEPQL